MTRVGAIDCGTNSLRLLIADLDPLTGKSTDVLRRMEIVRLGQGVDRTGEFAEEALARTFAVLREYAANIAHERVEQVRMVATSATRDVANRERFLAGCRDILGLWPDVVTGDEEARLSFAGATRSLVASHPPPYFVVDIGGGSTEFVVGSSVVDAAESVDIGCVRLTERYFQDDPPTLSQVIAARSHVQAQVKRVAARVRVERSASLVGLAGTVTTIAAVILELEAYDASLIHHSVISAEQVDAVAEHLLALPTASRRALAVMHPQRADVIAAGALILQEVLAIAPVPAMVVSEHDILDGIAWSLVESAATRQEERC